MAKGPYGGLETLRRPEPPAIKPCPFCGCDALVRAVDDRDAYPGSVEVRCEGCGVRTMGCYATVHSGTTGECMAIEAWNRRVIS